MLRARFVLIGLVFSLPMFGQLRQGPRIGLSMATQTAGQFLAWNGLPKFGPIAGWCFEVQWKRQIFFRMEPMYMSKGSWTRDAVTKTNTYVTQNFLELPLLARIDMQPGLDGYFLTAGIIYGYWIHGRTRTVVDGKETFDQTFDLSQPTVNRSQWSLPIGLGKQGPRWSWELRVQSSVTPFDELVRSQNLVVGIHFTCRLPTSEEKEKARAEKEEERKDAKPDKPRREKKESERELAP